MAEKNNILDIVNGISQAAANAYDGALDENGEPIKVGLKREEGDPILDKRVMDGFNVLLSGNTMTVKYHGEIMLKDVHRGDFEGEIDQMMADIVSYLKKEYKKITGNTLTLKKLSKEPNVLVQSMSKVRSWVQADCKYEIGGIPAEPELGTSVEERLDNSIKNWLGMGKSDKANRRYNVTPLQGLKQYPGTKKPQNVKGKRDEEPRG
tara:strand:- start:433 stop:1053 length:621 start_codon:yes stop_codon:yes gene_type:complete